MRRILAALLVAIIFALLWATAFSAELDQVWVKRLGDIKKGPERPPIFAVAAGVDGSNRIYGTFESGPPRTVDGLTEVLDAAQGTIVASNVYRGAGNGEDRPKDLLGLSAGGYVLAGETSVGGEPHLVIARYTAPPLALAWEHVLQGRGFSGAAALCLVGQDKVAVAGNVYSETTDSDYYVAVYEVWSGRLIWESRFDGGGSGGDYSRRVAADAQGNVYVTGYSTRWRGTTIGSVAELVVAKLAAADGRVLWKSVSTRPAAGVIYEYPHGLAVDRQGNAIVTGQEWSTNGDRLITAKYHSESGAILWIDRAEEQEKGLLPGRGAAVAVTSNGDPVVTGTRSIRSSVVSLVRTEFVTIRYSGTNGSRQWVRSFSDQGFAYGAGYDVISNGDVGIWVAGLVSQAGQTDFYTARLDDKGQILAASAFDAFGSSEDGFTREMSSFHDGHKLVRTRDGDVVLIGNYMSGGSSDGVLIRYRFGLGPTVITGPATNISRTGATLNATVTGRGRPGVAWLEWGLTTAYGGTGPRKEFPQNGTMSFNQPLSEITSQPHTTLNFRVVASTANGTVYGANRTFVTNTVPEAKPDTYHCKPDVQLQEFAVLLNDADADRDKLEITATTNGVHGAVAIGAGGVLTYTPGESFQGNDSFNYTIVDGFGGQASATVSMVNNAPVAVADNVETAFEQTISIPVTANDSDADGDAIMVVVREQGKHGAVLYGENGALDYIPDPEFTGIDSFNYELSDGWTTAQGTVTIRVLPPAAPVTRAMALSSFPVPGAGDGRVPEGARWLSFGQPATDLEGDLAFSARFVSQQGVQAGVFGPHLWTGSGAVALSGEPAPGFDEGARFVAFNDPAVARFTPIACDQAMYAVAFTAVVSGPGVSTRDDMGLWTTATVDGSLQLILREGRLLPAQGLTNQRVQGIQSFVLTQTGLWIVVRLAKGEGGVTRHNDLTLLYWDGARLQLRLEEGWIQNVAGKSKTIRTLNELVGAGGSVGVVPDYGGVFRRMLCRVTFTDGTQALLNGATLIATNDPVGDAIAGARWARFGMPALAGASESDQLMLAFAGEMRAGSGGVRPINDRGIFVAKIGEAIDEGEFLVRRNDSVPGLPGVRFASFKDPVIGSGGDTAFVARLTERGGAEKSEALFWNSEDSLRMLAWQKVLASGVPDAKLDRITAVALSGSEFSGKKSTPVFEAKLRSGSVSVGDGLWAVDSSGTVQLVLRSGMDIDVGAERKSLNRFSMLRALNGSLLKDRALDGYGHIVGVGTFNDGSQAILRITLP